MAFHTKKQYAAMCGMKTGDLSNYEKRGKVVYSGDLVDDTIEPNKSFLQKRQDQLKDKPPATAPEKKAPPSPKKPEKRVPTPGVKAPDAPKVSQPDGKKGELYTEQLENVRRKNEKLQLESDVLRTKRKKLDGESLPTPLVKSIVMQLTRSFVMEYKDLTDVFLMDIGKKYNISIEDEAYFRGFLITGLNKSTNRACAHANKEIKKGIEAFSVKKDVGERE